MVFKRLTINFITTFMVISFVHSYLYALSIGLEYENGKELSVRQKSDVLHAAQRWSNVITSTYTFNPQRQNSDVIIRVSVQEIDGASGTLAQAGPTSTFQDPNDRMWHTYRGEMTIDKADLDNPDLVNIVTHEIAHVLGFGTLWKTNNLIKLFGQDNPCFIGLNACNVYTALLNNNRRVTQNDELWAVPVENDGRPGTAGGHWRETVFNTELMTGYYNTGQINPLSTLTLASFQDMGFDINYEAAEIYRLPRNTYAPTPLYNLSLSNSHLSMRPSLNNFHAKKYCNFETLRMNHNYCHTGCNIQ